MIKKRVVKQIKVNAYKYIKEHYGKGHSLDKIKKWLIMYGYDENFVSKIVKEFQRKQFTKKISLSSFIVAIILLVVSLPVFNVSISDVTGAVTASQQGCCIDNAGICHSDSGSFCISKNFMYIRYDCFDLPYCKNNTMP